MILSLFFIHGCAAQSKLPAEMPARITVYFNEGGGMTRAFKKITIDEGVLEFEELKSSQTNSQSWSAKVSAGDLAKLYRTFVENKFDAIKNDERKGIVNDAGSESISISVDKMKSFGVTYGKNSPLSGSNLERYQKVRRALDDLIGKYQGSAAVSNGAEKLIQGTWRVEGMNDGYRWFIEWTFENGKFKQTGYPPIIQEGKYRVLRSTNERITLELCEQQGTFGSESRELQISIDKEENQLTISGTRGFTRSDAEKIN
jgi:hypothetical protein